MLLARNFPFSDDFLFVENASHDHRSFCARTLGVYNFRVDLGGPRVELFHFVCRCPKYDNGAVNLS